jgi:hypothetical protein
MTETMNDLLRRAAGHRVDVAQPEPHVTPQPGDIGIGRGGSAAVSRRRATTNEVVNARLRAGFRLVRSAQLRDGVSVDLDAPWGR